MLKRVLLACCFAGAACAATRSAPTGAPRDIAIFDAHIMQGEYGTAIEDRDCPSGGIKIKIDPALQGSEFMRSLRYGGGPLGPAVKFVIVDGVVRTKGPLGSGNEVTLVRVHSMREELYDPRRETAKMIATQGCEKDVAHREAWLKALQRKRS